MVAMAKKKTQNEPQRSPSYKVFVRVSPELEAMIDAYRDREKARQRFRPSLAQVVERGLRLVLEEEAKAKGGEQ